MPLIRVRPSGLKCISAGSDCAEILIKLAIKTKIRTLFFIRSVWFDGARTESVGFGLMLRKINVLWIYSLTMRTNSSKAMDFCFSF